MQALLAQFGSPLGEASGKPQELLIIGMGKLGGGELNVSSDIDLIFVYPEDGETNGSRKLCNHEFFTRLGRRLINLINEPTDDGFVFRVDMRLRPYGDSGPLVMSFAALEEYLVSQGREWERYAWIKARVIAPAGQPADRRTDAACAAFRVPQISGFRRVRIHAQTACADTPGSAAARPPQQHQARPGGIREIEFIAQVFQLIRGGRDASLRIRPTLQVLQLLRENGQLSAQAAADLTQPMFSCAIWNTACNIWMTSKPRNCRKRTRIRKSSPLPWVSRITLLCWKSLNHHRALVSMQFEQIFSTQEDDARRRATVARRHQCRRDGAAISKNWAIAPRRTARTPAANARRQSLPAIARAQQAKAWTN